MSYEHSFIGYIPPARYDGTPWNRVRIEQATDPNGTFTAVETQTLSPLDTNPASPQPRNVTTDLATLASGYFRLVFLDAANGESAASTPVLSPAASGDTPYFTPADLRAQSAPINANPGIYTDAVIDTIRRAVEDAIEHECGWAFVPRQATETLPAGQKTVLLTHSPVRSLDSATIRGVPLVSGDLALIQVDPDGILYRPGGWGALFSDPGYGQVTVTYTHGLDGPPGRIVRAAKLLAASWLVQNQSNIDARAMSVSNEAGTYGIFTQGIRNVMFDLPEVQAAVNSYGRRIRGVV